MSIVVEELTKRYAGHPVVNGVSLEVADGEFFVLLGSSGSGKSTLLRMIAGLSEVDAGRVLLHGRDVTDLPPAKRGVGFVFQSYALFRGMTVAENVEFALSIRGVSKAERRSRRDELLELVGLAGLGGRMPRQLSGGQQQRVALARALAHRPEVLLLDEPFGALDAKVRVDLRRTVREIQRELGITTVFVTHDQEEAFELADRLAVLSFGRLLEVGPPDELYLRPETEFVATFLGTANLLVGECAAGGVRLGPVEFPLTTRAEVADASRRVQVLFRPEDVALRNSADGLACPSLGEAVVEQRAFVGSFEKLRLRLPPLPGVRAIAPPVPFGHDGVWVEAARSQDQARRFPLQPGDTTWVGVQRVHALVHPGMKFLIASDVPLGRELAQLAHAQEIAFEGSPGDEGEEAERHGCDLVILTPPPREELERAERALRDGQHHLLLVPQAHKGQTPSRVLICVAVGEPGKEDVSFSGRLARHLGAEATVLTILPEEAKEGNRAQAERFLAGSARTLWRLGVTASTRIRQGNVRDEILAELAEGKHDLLVLGTPLPGRDGELSLGGLVEKLLPLPLLAELPVLLVRSPETVS
ncbi:MAG TPA: ATP-binding cassette domain-containing protein [Thermoanaerobaculia bacterium]|jgi:sulfate transport system ATP-binding protein|nr:ATP-binding cassette domain-containing protein [Thermoanaerobaculia bacterium]